MAKKAKIGQMSEQTKREQPIQIELTSAPPIVHDAHGTLLFDLAIVVGACYQMVIEPTQAGRVPKRLANKIFPLLHGARPAYYEDTDNYLDMIFAIDEALGLLKLHAPNGQKARFMPGPKLEAWGKLPLYEQVKRLLAIWQDPKYRGWSDVAGVNYRPTHASYNYYFDMQSARTGLLTYLQEECEPDTWYDLAMLLHKIKTEKPLVLREHARYGIYNGLRANKEFLANWDETDGEIIAGMLSSTFRELGMVTPGYQKEPALVPSDMEHEASNPSAFRFTELGAQVLWQHGLPKEPMEGSEPARTLIVQPNFELLLLHLDYPTLYQLLPFARVDQVEMVSKLTLTQESVRRGVEAGHGIEKTLRVLQAHSQKDLPQNVLYTLQDWGRLYKNATVAQILILEVENESVADEICASAKTRNLGLRRLGPCAIAVGDQVSLQVLRTTLEKEGVILHVQGDILTARDSSASSNPYYGRRR